MKLAVIGAGYFGKNHVRDLKKLGHEVVVCDLDEKNLDFCRQNLNADFTTKKITDILSDKSVAAATVCLPNHLHFPVTKKLLLSGKHVLVEKPMCLKSSDCKKLVELAKKKKLVLNVGNIFRFNPVIIKLKELVEQKETGKVFAVKFQWTNLDPVYPDRDIISDLGSHPFDIFNFVFGKNPKIVSCNGMVFRKKKGAEIAFINAVHKNVLVFFELSWLAPGKKRLITVIGDKKMLECDTLSQSITVTDNETLKTEEISTEKLNPLAEELSHFVECIEQNKKSRADGKIGAKIVEIIEQAQKKLR